MNESSAVSPVLSRIVGSLIGLSCCDSLGSSVEFQPRGSFVPLSDLIGGGKFSLQAGQWTDDSSQALIVAVSLLNPADSSEFSSGRSDWVRPVLCQLSLYWHWYQTGFLSSTAECFDIGMTTRGALTEFARMAGLDKEFAFENIPERLNEKINKIQFGSTSTQASGNGALMRIAPCALRFWSQPEMAVAAAEASARATHPSPLCIDACRYFTLLIIAAIRGQPKENLMNSEFILQQLPDDYWKEKPLHDDVVKIISGSFRNKTIDEIEPLAAVLPTLEAALWAFFHSNSFVEGALLAANLGGDADTIAAVYGQLAGAFYGVDEIPSRWKQLLWFSDLFHVIARELFVASTASPLASYHSSILYSNVYSYYCAIFSVYRDTLFRRVLPGPQQFRTAEIFDDAVQEFLQYEIDWRNDWKTAHETELSALASAEAQELEERLNGIFGDLKRWIEDNRNKLTSKWSRGPMALLGNLTKRA